MSRPTIGPGWGRLQGAMGPKQYLSGRFANLMNFTLQGAKHQELKKTKKNGNQGFPVNRFRRRTDEEIIRLPILKCKIFAKLKIINKKLITNLVFI
jgi:hypothetical protein